ncbi:MAG: LysR family transcriptional regulator [Verrucomicrobiota bacterium]
MQSKHESLLEKGFHFHELALFHRVADTGNFTRAGAETGLTQSAVSRQIQSLEEKVGAALLDRTTRRVRLTHAGRFFLRQAEPILNDLNQLVGDVRRLYTDQPPVVRVGIDQTIGLAYLPGFFHRFRRNHPDVHLQVEHNRSRSLLRQLDEDRLDVVAASVAGPLAPGLTVTHEFTDAFTAVLPPNDPDTTTQIEGVGPLQAFFDTGSWLGIRQRSATGRQLDSWAQAHGLRFQTSLEVDNYDLMINFVSLGLGRGLVPLRALPLYARRRKLRKVRIKPRFERCVRILTRKDGQPPEHLTQFIDSLLY